jgi:hypothetical protein
MTFFLIVSCATVGLLFVAWAVGLMAPIGSTMRRASIEYRKNRALGQIRAEGSAARERIRGASRQRTRVGLDEWLAKERRRQAQVHGWAVTGITAGGLALVIVVAAAWHITESRRGAHSSQARLDTVIANIKEGDCANFTNNFQTGALPKYPKIVPCSRRAATFRVAWLGVPSSGASCPARYSGLSSWADSAGATICMDRVYRIDQCMQGTRDNGYAYSWIDEAVVPCSLAPTAQYPYIVRIVSVFSSGQVSCPGDSSTETNPDDVSGLTLCIQLWSNYF